MRTRIGDATSIDRAYNDLMQWVDEILDQPGTWGPTVEDMARQVYDIDKWLREGGYPPKPWAPKPRGAA